MMKNSEPKKSGYVKELPKEAEKNKSLILTYLLWLIGGIFGLHHFYLGRDLHGFIFWSTGGCCMLGWLRDFLVIPRYLKGINKDPRYLAKRELELKICDTPESSSWRFTGMVTTAYIWGTVVHYAVPRGEFAGYNWQFLYILVPFACALGVWAMGNIGREQGTLLWPLFGAYAIYPLYKKYPGDVMFLLMILTSAYSFDWFSKKWRRKEPKKRPIYKRAAILMTAGMFYLALLGCYVYFNGTVTDSEGEQVPIHEALHHFFTSPWWRDLKQSLWETFEVAKHHGWAEVWKMAVELLDPHGEQHAYSILDLDIEANQTLINSRCKQLSVKWHPDRVKDPLGKQEAQEKFYEIQQACEILSASKAKRRLKNKRSP